MKRKVFFVEDERLVGRMVKKALEMRALQVFYYTNGLDAIRAFKKDFFDVAILDISLPYKTGYEVAAEIKQVDSKVPILFLSGNTGIEDKLKGFRMGAEDYLTKPFDTRELVSRVEVLLRRTGAGTKHIIKENKEIIQIGKYKINTKFNQLFFNDEVQKLTSRELELIIFLYQNKNEVVRRDLILQEVWGEDDYYKGRSLDVFISRLRKYFAKDSRIEIINSHSIGFKLAIL